MLCPEDAVELSRIPIALAAVVAPVFAPFKLRLETILLAMVELADSTAIPSTREDDPDPLAVEIIGAAAFPMVFPLIAAVTPEAVLHLIPKIIIEPVLEFVAAIELIVLFEMVVDCKP